MSRVTEYTWYIVLIAKASVRKPLQVTTAHDALVVAYWRWDINLNYCIPQSFIFITLYFVIDSLIQTSLCYPHHKSDWSWYMLRQNY
jgi:hypothetical protein